MTPTPAVQPTSDALRPGLLVLHGNRLELLAETVFAWLARHPLGPLEDESFLVQSNGMAEWLKMEIATAQGVCAAVRVELPARFVWRVYRAVLGRAAVPAVSALDKLPMVWRLMRLLPELARGPEFAPVAGFLGDGDPARRLQLAERLADLYDQYQVYRGDWLQDWAAGVDRTRAEAGQDPAQALPVPPDQAWQPSLWRALLEGLEPDERAATRPDLHRRFLAALEAGGAWPQLPRRVVLFGTTHIPHQTLEAVCALSTRCQVLLAVPNPCRFHWADTIDGHQLLRAARRRQPTRGGREPGAVAPHDLHAHGHPLLSAWGRQARDFVRQLDAFDDVQRARARFELPRVDLFDEGAGATLLEQVQARIRDLVPLAEQPRLAVAASDRSIVFHVAHGAQREVEILHDQLLHLFAQPPGGRALDPRDVVVMVPDIDAFAPAIRSVFGQYARHHPRHIPWGIADQRDRGRQPLLVGLEWLLRAPRQRFASSELRDLLDVQAVSARFGIAAADLDGVAAWIEGAGVRWGLHAAHRESLGLAACGEANTWRFGLRRMLLGYATGELSGSPADAPAGSLTEAPADGPANAPTGGHGGIEPYAEIAGLSAGLAGSLAEFLDALDAWWTDAARPRPPGEWATRLRALVEALFAATDDLDRALLVALDDALAAWLEACQAAAFEEPIGLDVVREAWLAGIDAPGGSARFKAGGVTFCTLLPMRAIPFEAVCLLGLNDGDYPRRAARSDFDLMALPGRVRPGDRSRRDDDRQLMLDALLSARRLLYVSWAGRSVRDNQEQPPSVLVAQLRDYLEAGWSAGTVPSRTVEHPLQPFSRRYFEPRPAGAAEDELLTYAGEWRAAHVEATEAGSRGPAVEAPGSVTSGAVEPRVPEGAGNASDPDGAVVRRSAGPANGHGDAPGADPRGPRVETSATTGADTALTTQRLARFLRNPVKAFFRQRLQVVFDDGEASADDDELFVATGLERWQLLDEAIRGVRRQLDDPAAGDWTSRVAVQVERLQRAGRLPMAGPGARARDELVGVLTPMVRAWQEVLARHPQALGRQALRLVHPDLPRLAFDDWLVGLRAGGAAGAAGAAVGEAIWVDLQAGLLADRKLAVPRPDKLLAAWVQSLAAAACGQSVDAILIGSDAVVQVRSPPPDASRGVLLALLQACHDGLTGAAPTPTAVLTGLQFLADPTRARAVFEGSERGGLGERREACLARLYPDYEALAATPGFVAGTRRLYAPYAEWLQQCVTLTPLPGAAAPEASDDD